VYPLLCVTEVRRPSLDCSSGHLSYANTVTRTVFRCVSGQRFAAGCLSNGTCAVSHVLPRGSAVVYRSRRLYVPLSSSPKGVVANTSPALLITCGTMTEPVLRADTVDLVTTPSMNTSGSASSFIFVYYTEAVTYALPLDQCRSWFVSYNALIRVISDTRTQCLRSIQAFISHFHEFWPKTLKFTHRDRLVTASDWPSIFNLARLSSNMVVLVLKLGYVDTLVVDPSVWRPTTCRSCEPVDRRHF
jgi:hypothetical protein